jgi:uncharacterized protein (TIGR03435 family)
MARMLLVASIFGGTMAAAQPSASSGSTTPVFDVATIKPNNTFSGSWGTDTNADTFSAKNLSLKMLLENAYGIKQNLITGLPGWAESAHYDIVAKVVDNAAAMKDLTREQLQGMLQQLLADRFQLAAHIEVKTLPVFELEVASGGIRFKESPPRADNPGEHESMTIRNGDMTAEDMSMGDLTNTLTDQVGRKVIDKTGLTGRYDLNLKWQPDNGDSKKELTNDSAPSIFTALQQQLGLKLQPAKGPVDTLVVDRIATPSEN